MTNEAELLLSVSNKKGIHARAAAKFVKTVSQFEVKVLVAKTEGAGVNPTAEPVESSGGSILGLMMLGAECGSKVRIRISGTQALDAANELKKLIEEKFGEE